jgi:hypothetical protein
MKATFFEILFFDPRNHCKEATAFKTRQEAEVTLQTLQRNFRDSETEIQRQ